MTSRRRAPGFSRLLALLAVAAVMVPAAAHAHQTSMKYLQLEVHAHTVEAELRAAVPDVASAVGLDGNRVTAAEVVASATVAPSLASWVALRAGDRGCVPGPARAQLDRDPRFVTVRWSFECSSETTDLTLDLESFFLLDAAHTMVLRLAGLGATSESIIGVEDSPLHLRLGRPSGSFVRWVRLGIEHILGGGDHVAFVVTLLLAVVISPGEARVPPAAGPHRWRLRTPRQALRAIAVLVTSFSVSHSLTLIAASLGWLDLPTRLVETTIAVSILYAAIENLARPDAPWRWALTFGFGLVHGLGFASALRELLPVGHVVVPLVGFNMGVEIGQLLIVAVGMPLLLSLGKGLGADRYRTRLLPIVSGLLAVVAIVWGLERAFSPSL